MYVLRTVLPLKFFSHFVYIICAPSPTNSLYLTVPHYVLSDYV